MSISSVREKSIKSKTDSSEFSITRIAHQPIWDHILSFVTAPHDYCIKLEEETGNGFEFDGRSFQQVLKDAEIKDDHKPKFAFACKFTYEITKKFFLRKGFLKDFSIDQECLRRNCSLEFQAIEAGIASGHYFRSHLYVPQISGERFALVYCYVDRLEAYRVGEVGEVPERLIVDFLQTDGANLDTLVIAKHKMQDALIQRIAQALQVNSSVSELSFCHCCITEEAAVVLATAISQQENSAIKSVDLSNPNAQTNRFTKCPIDGQRRWSDIQFNKIGDRGARALVDALIKKPSFRQLNLSGNPISDECAEELKMRMIQAGKYLEPLKLRESTPHVV